MEQVISAVTAALVGLVAQMSSKWGTGLAFGAIASVLSWASVEHLTPPSWSARKNRITAALVGTVLTMLAHTGAIVSYGPGAQGYVAAFVYGVLGGGGAWPFHDLLAKRFFPDALLRPTNGGSK